MFITTAAAMIIISGLMVLSPAAAEKVVDRAFGFITSQFGVVYVWASIAVLAFLIWLASGRFGSVMLGSAGNKPDYSEISWGGMLFCAGIGTSIMHWGTIEWAYYYQAPPFGIAPGSTEAMEWASSYGIFHWGISGWAFYALPAVALAFLYHVKKTSALRLSIACEPLLGHYANGVLGRVIDVLFMVGLLGAAGTGIGFTAPLITGAFSQFFETPNTFVLTVAAVALVVIIFAISVYAGLEKGIKRLSNLNVGLTLILLLFILLAGPTGFILKTATNSVGHVLQYFIKMTTWTDPFTDSQFIEQWTVFYWAWWIALGPFVGLFIAKISGGRTIRQLIVGVLGYGTLGCVFCFSILGNYAMYLEINKVLPVIDILNQQDAATAVIQVMMSVPIGKWVLPLFFFICVVFAATSYDSASYALAAVASKKLTNNAHPSRWHRVFWAIGLGIVPLTLLFLGGLKTLQTASIIASIPVLLILIIVAISLVRSLRSEQGLLSN